MALSLGEDRGQESYPTGCVDTRGGNRADRLRFEDGDGIDRAAAPAPSTGLHASAAAGTLCGARADAEAVCFQAEAGAACAAPREEDDDQHHHNDDDGAEPLIAVSLA